MNYLKTLTDVPPTFFSFFFTFHFYSGLTAASQSWSLKVEFFAAYAH